MPRTVLVAPVPNRDITAAAREELRGRWIHFNLLVLGLLVINILLQLVVNHLPWMLGLSVILSCGIQIGVCRFFLNRVRGAETDDLSALKLGFIRFGNVVVTTLLAIIWIAPRRFPRVFQVTGESDVEGYSQSQRKGNGGRLAPCVHGRAGFRPAAASAAGQCPKRGAD